MGDGKLSRRQEKYDNDLVFCLAMKKGGLKSGLSLGEC